MVSVPGAWCLRDRVGFLQVSWMGLGAVRGPGGRRAGAVRDPGGRRAGRRAGRGSDGRRAGRGAVGIQVGTGLARCGAQGGAGARWAQGRASSAGFSHMPTAGPKACGIKKSPAGVPASG